MASVEMTQFEPTRQNCPDPQMLETTQISVLHRIVFLVVGPRFFDVNKYFNTHEHSRSVVGCRFVDPCLSVGVNLS